MKEWGDYEQQERSPTRRVLADAAWSMIALAFYAALLYGVFALVETASVLS